MSRSADLFVQLVRACLPRGGGALVLHHVYLDESCTHDGSPIMAVAGYVFSDTQAGRFTREWAKTLPKLGISFARMTDCATGNGEYKNLTMEARIASEKALIAQIRNRAAVGIAVAVDPTKYQAALAHDKFALTPYTFCLSMCVTGANRWALENGVKELAFFFESGHADQSQANDLMNRISKNIPPQSRTYVSHTFADKKLVQPLQAADMLAWQYAHYLIRRRDGHPMRKDFVALRRPTDKFVEFVDDHIQKWVQLNDELNREVLEQIRQIYPDDPQAVQYAESVLNNRPSAPAA